MERGHTQTEDYSMLSIIEKALRHVPIYTRESIVYHSLQC